MCFLDTLIPTSVPNRTQIIKLYNSLMPIEYRQRFVQDITTGTTLRIGIVTDSLTYGLDIPNLPRVIVFDLCASPEIMKQKMGRCGRDGKPATVITYAPSWVQEVSGSESQTQKAKDEAKRRNALPPMLRKWFNPTLLECPRYTDNKYYGDDFIQHDNCCVVCDPGPEQDTDREIIDGWKERLENQKSGTESTKLPRSDGTYRALIPAEREALKQDLISWRSRIWRTLRRAGSAADAHTPAEIFFPSHILTSLVNHAHICSEFSRFKLTVQDWKHLDTKHAKKLYKFLVTKLVPYKKDTPAKSVVTDPNSRQPLQAVSNPDRNLPGTSAPEQDTRTRIALSGNTRLVLGAHPAVSSTTAPASTVGGTKRKGSLTGVTTTRLSKRTRLARGKENIDST